MIDLQLGDPDMLWLNVTNIALGIVTLICCGAVAYAIVKEAVVRAAERREARQAVAGAHADDHAFPVPGLGLTMADGGEKTGEQSQPK